MSLFSPPLSPTSPAPQTGYTTGSWWQGPLGDLIQGASGALEEAIGVNQPEPEYLEVTPPAQASLAPAGVPPLLLWGGIGLGLFLLTRKR